MFRITVTQRTGIEFIENIKNTQNVLRTSIFSLFTVDLWELALAEVGMVSSTLICLFLQQQFQKGTLSWQREGHVLQHAVQSLWLGVWVYLPFYLQWEWYALPS